VLIPRGVKVLCFDTLLQVLILKVVKVAVSVFCNKKVEEGKWERGVAWAGCW
jgi:hypothetical protein